MELALAAEDLLAFFQRFCLDGEARRWEPNGFVIDSPHVASRVARSGRRIFLRLPRSWRRASLLAAALSAASRSARRLIH